MHTQEVVCPGCGKPAIVNVIKDKTTTTPCQHCKKKIIVRADRENEIVDLKMEGDCFITTACLNARAGDRNGEHTLDVLRRFRDEYVRTLSDGDHLLEHYYDVAPKILDAIKSRSNSNEVLQEIYAKHLVQAVDLIELHRNDEALKTYSFLVLKLEEEYLLCN